MMIFCCIVWKGNASHNSVEVYSYNTQCATVCSVYICVHRVALSIKYVSLHRVNGELVT